MKLLRYGPVGEERPALLDELGEIRDLGTYRGYQWQIFTACDAVQTASVG